MKLSVWAHPIRDFENGGIEDTFKKLSNAKIRDYYPFVAHNGQTCFKSSYIHDVTDDLLSKVINTASKYEIGVHPIFGFGSLGSSALKPYKPVSNGKHKFFNKKWACPSWSENRDLTLKMVKELIDNYNVKGIHLDYVRYPNSHFSLQNPCECDACRTQRKKIYGVETFTGEDLKEPGKLYKELTMRAGNIKDFVKKIRKLTKSKGLELSMAARARYSKDALAEGQDWVQWSKEDLIDVISPMSYNDCFDRYKRFVNEHTMLLGPGKSLYYAGIGRSSSLGTITPDEMIKQIKYAKQAGADGCTIFKLSALTDEDFNKLSRI